MLSLKIDHYLPLLTDSLTNGYRQVIFLYEKLQNKEREKDLYLNVCSGKFLHYSNKKHDCKIFYQLGNFPLVYMNGNLGKTYKEYVLKVLEKYDEFLTYYDKVKDPKMLENLIKKEFIPIEENECPQTNGNRKKFKEKEEQNQNNVKGKTKKITKFLKKIRKFYKKDCSKK